MFRLEQTIRLMDLLYSVNSKRETDLMIPPREFQNDAINNNIELKQMMATWAKNTKVMILNKKPLNQKPTVFTLCCYHWVFNTHNKALMLQMYNKVEWSSHQQVFMTRYQSLPSMNPINYVLEISRDRILEDSLKKIVQVSLIQGKDPLKLPLKI